MLRPELCTKQEEADTRLFLHAKDAQSRRFATVTMRCDDTDVLLMACYHQWDLRCKIIIETSGNSGRKHLIDVRALATALGRPLCRALLPYYALTGCDTVSAFSGREKKGGFFILKEDLKEDKVYCQNLSQLGDSIDITSDTKEKVETFVCRLYGYHCDSADALRHELFTKPLSKKEGPPETQNMPPTSDALGKHILRANYQTYIWKNAMNADIEVPLPSWHGWLMSDGQLIKDWMDNDPAPLSVLEKGLRFKPVQL